MTEESNESPLISFAKDQGLGLASQVGMSLLKLGLRQIDYQQEDRFGKLVLDLLGLGPTEEDRIFNEIQKVDARLQQIEVELKNIATEVATGTWYGANERLKGHVSSIRGMYKQMPAKHAITSTVQAWRQGVIDPTNGAMHHVQEIQDLLGTNSEDEDTVLHIYGDLLLDRFDPEHTYSVAGPQYDFLSYYAYIVSWMLKGAWIAKLAYLTPDESHQVDTHQAAKVTNDYLSMGQEHRKVVFQKLIFILYQMQAINRNKQYAWAEWFDAHVMGSGAGRNYFDQIFSPRPPQQTDSIVKNRQWYPDAPDHPPAPAHLDVFGREIELMEEIFAKNFCASPNPVKEEPPNPAENRITVYSHGLDGGVDIMLDSVPPGLKESMVGSVSTVEHPAVKRAEFWNLTEGNWRLHKPPGTSSLNDPTNHQHPYYDEQFLGDYVAVSFENHRDGHGLGEGPHHATIRFVPYSAQG